MPNPTPLREDYCADDLRRIAKRCRDAKQSRRLLSIAADRRVVSGIIFVIKNGLRWCDAPSDYGPHKTLYNRFIRWSRLGVFDRIFSSLVVQEDEPEILMIDATHLKAHRTACSLLKKGMFPTVLAVPKAG